MAYEIRQFGDPVLKSRAAPVRGFDDSLRRLTNGMLATLRAGERWRLPVRLKAWDGSVAAGASRRGAAAAGER